MTLAELIKESFVRGDSYLLIGERHFESAGLLGLDECLELIVKLNEIRPVRIILECNTVDDDKPVPLRESDIPSDMSRAEIATMRKFMDKKIPLYGCENGRTDPFRDISESKEEVDKILKQINIYDEFISQSGVKRLIQDIEDYPEGHYLKHYRSIAEVNYAENDARLKIPNIEFSGFITQFDQEDFCNFVGGTTHPVASYNKDKELISPGMHAILQESNRKGAIVFVTTRASVGETYMPQGDKGHSYGQYDTVCHLDYKKPMSFFKADSDKAPDKDQDKKPPENNAGGGCQIM